MNPRITLEVYGIPKGFIALCYRCPQEGELYMHEGAVTTAARDKKSCYMVVRKTSRNKRTFIEGEGLPRYILDGDYYERRGHLLRWDGPCESDFEYQPWFEIE